MAGWALCHFSVPFLTIVTAAEDDWRSAPVVGLFVVRSRMGPSVDFPQVLDRDVHVNLQRVDLLVPQQRLNTVVLMPLYSMERRGMLAMTGSR